MDTTIEVSPRETTGKGSARKSRARGRIPGVLYGPSQDPAAIELEPGPLLKLFKTTQNRNTVVDLKVGGDAPVPCLVREVQRHPVSRDILHIDFYAVPTEREIEVMVPLRPVGRPAGAILGGRLRLIRRRVRARCRYNHIPDAFEVDVSHMNIGDMIQASEIPLPEHVELVFDHDFNVITVYGKKRKAQDAEAAEAAPVVSAAEAK
jgi:large subunit ribosomal protein L25